MIWVTSAKYLEDYKISIQFSDGTEGVVDLSSQLWGPVFEPLKDKANFKRFKVNPDIDTISWYNGADFSPEFLRENAELH
jgi:hypothetical protein